MPRYYLKRSPCDEDHVARALVGAGEDRSRASRSTRPPRSPWRCRPTRSMPPSAMTGHAVPGAYSAHSRIAVICGTPIPATTRVVQIEPGPMPHFDRVGAGLDQRLPRPSAVATLPAITCDVAFRLDSRTVSTPEPSGRAPCRSRARRPRADQRALRARTSRPTPTAAPTRRRPARPSSRAGTRCASGCP